MSDSEVTRDVLITYVRPRLSSLASSVRQKPCKKLDIFHWEFGQGWPTGDCVYVPDDEEGEFEFADAAVLERVASPGQYLYLKEIARVGPSQYEFVFLDYTVPEGYWELRRHSKPAPVLETFPFTEVILAFRITKGDIPVFQKYYQTLIEKGQVLLPLKL